MNRTTDILRNLAQQVDRAADGDSLQFDPEQIGSGLLELVGKVPTTRHPLGFCHFELTEELDLPDARVRAHIWTADSLRDRDNLGAHHAHTWSLASCMLIGSLRDTWYEAHAADQGSFHGIEVDYANDVVRPTSQRYELKVVRALDVLPGTVYRLPPDAPHNTDVLTIPSATLVVARESGLSSTPVFSPVALSETRSGERLPLSDEDAAAAIEAAFELPSRPQAA
jgi:hypothetical protein